MKPESDEHESFIPTRASLLSRLRDLDDSRSWDEFFNVYWKLIHGVAVKAGLSDQDAQDVAQATLLECAKKLPDFRYNREQGSFKGWLLKTTQWKIGELLRAEKRPEKFLGKRVAVSDRSNRSGKTPTEERLPDPTASDLETVWNQEWQRHLMALALTRLKREVIPEHYRIFHLHVIKEQPIKAVAQALGVPRPRIYLVKHRLSKLLKKHLQEAENQPL